MNRVPPLRRTLPAWLLVPALLLAACSAGADATPPSASIGPTAAISPAAVPSPAASAMLPASAAPATAAPATVAPGTPGPASTPRPTVRPVPTPTRSPAPPRITPAPSSASAKLTISEAADGRTVTVHVGTLVTLELHSTYWQVDGSSNAAVLGPVSGPTAVPASPGTCVPGGGCGTVVAVFRAIAPGRATVTAARTTCGEALLCTGSAGAFDVTVVVER